MITFTLKDFIDCGDRNLWIKYKDLAIYLRRDFVVVENNGYKVITLGNISNKRRPDNVESKTDYERTGLFKEFEMSLRSAAQSNDFQGIFVESVINDFLPDVLLRYGYRRVFRNNEGIDFIYLFSEH